MALKKDFQLCQRPKATGNWGGTGCSLGRGSMPCAGYFKRHLHLLLTVCVFEARAWMVLWETVSLPSTQPAG